MEPISIYTDGSCHTQYRIGGWAIVVMKGIEKNYFSGTERDTTHNRMEIVAVLEGINYATFKYGKGIEIKIFSDSQYVVELPSRFSKLQAKNFITKKGASIQNEDLVKKLMEVLTGIKYEFIKVKAHNKTTDAINYNHEVDQLSRQIVRKAVKEII